MWKVQVTKWVGMAAGIWVQSLAGNGNVFPHFAPTLKHQLHINQVQLNNLGVAKDFGENVGLLAGMLTNLVPPWTILSIGALEGLFGYGTVWLVMSGRIAPLAYWQMCILLLIGANSTTWFNTAVLVTSMRNFPDSRGPVVGIVKGFVGLSSAIYTQIFVAILMNNATDLVLLLAVGPFAVCFLVMYFIQPVASPAEKKPVSPQEQNGFAFILIICIALAVYLFVATLVETFLPEISPFVYQIVIAVMVVFLLSPLVVPAKFAFDEYCIRLQLRGSDPNPNKASRPPQLSVKIDDGLREPFLKPEEKQQWSTDSNPKPLLVTDEEEGATLQQAKLSSGSHEDEKTTDSFLQKPERYTSYDTTTLLPSPESRDSEKEKSDRVVCLSVPRSEDGEVDPGTLLVVGEGAVRRRKGPRRGEDFTLLQALVKADFWLLFFTYFCGLGTVITAVNNLGQIGQAQGYSNVTIFVSLVSIMNFLARLGAGALSEHYVRSSALPRTVWMIAAQLLMILGYLLFAAALPGSLYVGSVILGVGFGVHVAIMVPTASELFGLRHFGMIYNFMTMGNPIGSLLFSGILAGYLYDKESQRTPTLNGVHEHIVSRYFEDSSDSANAATCLGAHCFQLTFLIMAVVCVVGVILNIVLTLRIRPVYGSLYGSSSRNSSYQSFPVEGQGSASDSSPGSTPQPAPSTLQTTTKI